MKLISVLLTFEREFCSLLTLHAFKYQQNNFLSTGRARYILNNSSTFVSLKINKSFFTIDLPRYSTIEIMRSRLRYAIQHCTAIGNIFFGGGEGVAKGTGAFTLIR